MAESMPNNVTIPVMILVAAIGALAPLITAMNNGAERRLQELTFHHQSQATWVRMSVDPELPLQARAQVLRFLVQDGNEAMVRAWADSELARLEIEIEDVQRTAKAVDDEVEEMQRRLADARAEYASVQAMVDADPARPRAVMERAAQVQLAEIAVEKQQIERARLGTKLGEPDAFRVYKGTP